MKNFFFALLLLSFTNLSLPNNNNNKDTTVINKQFRAGLSADSAHSEADTAAIKQSFTSILYQLQILITEQEKIIQIYRKAIAGLIIVVAFLAVALFLNMKKQIYFNRFPYYRQKKGYHPGLVCLQMISRYFGKKISYKRMKKISGITGTQKEIPLNNLINTAENIGIKIKVAKTDIDQLLSAVCPPVIVYLSNHMVILYKVNNEYVFIADPYYGFLKLKLFYFVSVWYSAGKDHSGIALLVKPSDDFAGKSGRLKKILATDYSAIKQLEKKYWNSIVCEI
jgi:hypothetical protein